MIGQLISKTFVTGKTNVEEATAAIKQDIVRSLASRLEMHVDSLIEEEDGSPEGTFFLLWNYNLYVIILLICIYTYIDLRHSYWNLLFVLENITLHEPPRRILIHLHKSRVTLSSYLFPGEEPQEALIYLQELLDVDVEDLDIQKEIECHAGNLLQLLLLLL